MRAEEDLKTMREEKEKLLAELEQLKEVSQQ